MARQFSTNQTTSCIINVDDDDDDDNDDGDGDADVGYYTAPESAGHAAPHVQPTSSCIFGCKVNKLALCSFPVMDPKRCNTLLKFFNISEERVKALGGLENLRVCLQHFNKKKEMTRARVKTTPLRTHPVQTTPTKAAVAPAMTAGKQYLAIYGVKRNLSISSEASEQSQRSDCAPPQLTQLQSTAATATATATVTTTATNFTESAATALPTNTFGGRKRKIYEITQDSSNSNGQQTAKRKMYLLVEDEPNAPVKGEKKKVIILRHQSPNDEAASDFNENLKHILNSIFVPNGQDKDKPQQQQQQQENDAHRSGLRQPLKPRMLESCILPTQKHKDQHQHQQQPPPLLPPTSSFGIIQCPALVLAAPPLKRQPITLPPKKNRTKISPIMEQQQQQQQQQQVDCHVIPTITLQGTLQRQFGHNQTSTLANSSLKIQHQQLLNVNATNNANNNSQLSFVKSTSPAVQSVDLKFLLSLLPKLKSIAEPEKQNVKLNIEKYVSKIAQKYVA